MRPKPAVPWRLSALLSIALLSPARLGAVIGAIDTVPAATLLFPYFEVDVNNVNGQTTLIAITNSGKDAVLTNLVIWSDLAVPVFQVNIYLTGYDIQVLNLRDIIVSGFLPRTASAGQDPANTISPQGPSSLDFNYASCNGILPPADLSAAAVADLKKALTGQSSTTLGGCAGRSFGDDLARGYVTVDTVNVCGTSTPATAGYFAGVSSIQNVLLGDYSFVFSGQNFAQGEVAAHIEASNTDPLTTTSGNYTFYGRYVTGTAADRREPLATTWATNAIRSINGQDSSIIAWRDPGRPTAPFPCATTPVPYPLQQSQIVKFDTQSTGVLSAETPFQWATQRTSVNGSNPTVTLTPKVGWLYLNLNTTTVGGQFGAIKQSWVVLTQDSLGRFSGAFTPTVLGKATTSSNVTLSPIPSRLEEE